MQRGGVGSLYWTQNKSHRELEVAKERLNLLRTSIWSWHKNNWGKKCVDLKETSEKSSILASKLSFWEGDTMVARRPRLCALNNNKRAYNNIKKEHGYAFSCKHTWEMQFRNAVENVQLFKKFHRCNISQKRRINVGPVSRDFSPVSKLSKSAWLYSPRWPPSAHCQAFISAWCFYIRSFLWHISRVHEIQHDAHSQISRQGRGRQFYGTVCHFNEWM